MVAEPDASGINIPYSRNRDIWQMKAEGSQAKVKLEADGALHDRLERSQMGWGIAVEGGRGSLNRCRKNRR